MPIPILIDSDMALDDWMAILYLLREPAADVKAITVVATGEAHARPGVRSALRLLTLAGHAHIPVCAGQPRPLKTAHAFPFIVRLMVDLRLFLRLPQARGPASCIDAPAQIAKTLEESPQPLTIVAIGPLTNLGLVLQQRPSLKDKIANIFIMGGAVDVPGNIMQVDPRIQNETAEWNIYCDPHAANLVLASGAPVTLVPLDATNDVPFTRTFLERLRNNSQHPAAGFLYRALKRIPARVAGEGQDTTFFFWDALAAVLAVYPQIGKYETALLRVVEEEGPHSGRTARDETGWPACICTGADRSAFEDIFLGILNGK